MPVAQLLVALGVVGVFVYLSHYLKKKAENLASKEDVATITQKIEAVRAQHVAEIEKLKATLEHSIRQQSVFEEHQRQALLTFFDGCVSLIADKLRINFGDFPFDEGRSLVDYEESMSNLFTSLFTNYHRLILYFGPGSDLPAAAERIVHHSINVQRVFKAQFGKVKLAVMIEGEAHKSGNSADIERAVRLANEAVRTYYDALRPHTDALHSAFQTYLVALNGHLRSLGVGTLPNALPRDAPP